MDSVTSGSPQDLSKSCSVACMMWFIVMIIPRAVLKTKSEGLHFHSHTERKCVFWSLMLLYSEGLVTLYRLIHGQSLILISEIFMDTARLRPKAGMSAPDIRISVPI